MSNWIQGMHGIIFVGRYTTSMTMGVGKYVYGDIKHPCIMPMAIKDIILGIPTTQITLAYDESIDSKQLKATIELVQSSGISMRIYQITNDVGQDGFFSYVKEAHSSYQKALSIILSESSVAELMLGKIQEQDLINRNILYLFLWEKLPVSEKFKSILLEAMRVAIITERRLGTYRIYYNQAKPDGRNELTLVNWWNHPIGLFRFPVLPPADSIFNNFGGRLFSIPVLHKPPWNFVTYENGTFLTYGGRDDQLLKLLASKLNFRFEYFDPPERIQGSGIGVNGSFRGVLGLIWRREAPFFLGDVTITYERRRIVDFSSPTLADCGTFATHSPRLLNEALALVRPFHWQVWLPVAATALLSGPVLFTVIEASTFWRKRKRRRKMEASKVLQDCIWFSVGIFMKQSVKEPSKLHKARLLMILLSIVATYVIGGLYSATLTSLLAKPAREQPIQTLDELEYAMRNKGYQLLVERHSSYLSILQNGTGVYGRLWRLMKGNDFMVDSVEEGMRHVQDTSSMTAILAGRETLFFDSRRFGAHHFHLADCLFTRYSAIAMQIGSPFQENFDRLIIRISEAGILTKMTRDEYERLGDKVEKFSGMSAEEESDLKAINEKIQEDTNPDLHSHPNDGTRGVKDDSRRSQKSSGGNDGERKLLKPVNAKMLQGAFFVLLIGYSISSLVFYGEVAMIYHKAHRNKKSEVHRHGVSPSILVTRKHYHSRKRNLKKIYKMPLIARLCNAKSFNSSDGGKSSSTSDKQIFAYNH